ncbi:MAG: Response regulator PleD [Acidobacteria bacterium ADurb.Bin340]|nr:MAG: Response regulator PleD [Acidobacteria bacterium ADurb.Bin340]
MATPTLDVEDAVQRTILVVDDDAVIRRALEAQLSRLGCRLIFASDGLEALDVLAELHPDLVLLDIVMPGMDGFEVCRRIKGNLETQDIPVVHLTSLSGEAKEQSFACGADDFLNKPPNFVELRSRIRSHLLIRSLLAERAAREIRPGPLQWEPGRPARVLAVLGDEEERGSALGLLAQYGHDPLGAGSLREALEKLKLGLPDLLVLDHRLPDGAGASFAAHLRNFARSRDLPILMLCPREALDTDLQAAEAGPMDFLTRPFQPLELKVRVSVLMRHGLLLRDRDGSRSAGGSKPSLMDPQTGAFTDAFLEAHLDLFQKGLGAAERSVSVLAAGLRLPTGNWGEAKELIQEAACLLRGNLGPGEALCRVADHTFVMVLPGTGAEALRDRIRQLREAGFQGTLAGLPAPRRIPAATLLRKLAEAIRRVEGD